MVERKFELRKWFIRLKETQIMVKQLLPILCVAGISLVAADKKPVDTSKLPPVAAKTGVTYDQDIKPIFEKSCFKCHGPEKQKGKLRLDSLSAVKKGGEDGEVVIPGKSDQSPLVHAIAGLIEDGQMPPEGKGDPLTKDKIGLIRAWIDQGAK